MLRSKYLTSVIRTIFTILNKRRSLINIYVLNLNTIIIITAKDNISTFLYSNLAIIGWIFNITQYIAQSSLFITTL